MVKDHFDALQFVLNAAKKRKVDSEFIQAINAKVMKSTGSIYQTVFGEIDANKGAFRKGNVSAGGSYFVNFDKVVDYTERLVVSLKEQMGLVITNALGTVGFASLRILI